MVWNFITAIALVALGIIVTFIIAKMASDKKAINKGLNKLRKLYSKRFVNRSKNKHSTTLE